MTDTLPRPLNLIGGEWVPPASGREMEVRSPLDGKVFTTIADSTPEDIDAAVAAARAAYEDGDWGRLSATDRGRLLMRYAAAILDAADELAAIETRDNGKPLAQARADMVLTARYFEYYGGAAGRCPDPE